MTVREISSRVCKVRDIGLLVMCNILAVVMLVASIHEDLKKQASVQVL
jgi:hypothetical protein